METTMANTVAKVRFVRCPRCNNLLPEFADVPMYQCGGCGAVLQAKNCMISKQYAVLGAPETDPSKSISDNEFSNNGSTTLEKQGEKHDTFQNFSSTSSDAESYCNEKGDEEKSLIENMKQEKRESPDSVLTATEERESCSIHQLALSSKDENGSTRAKSEYSFSGEEEKSLNLSEQGSDILRPNNKLEASLESLGQSAASEQEMFDREHEVTRNNSLNSLAASDDGLRDHVRGKYHLMSRRTFRNQCGSGSVSGCSKANETLDTDRQKRMASLGSESFYSVQSFMEPEKEGPSQSVSKDSSYFRRNASQFQNGSTSTRLKNLNQNRSELRQLVEELKDQLGGLYEEKKLRSQFSGPHPLRPLFFSQERSTHQWPQQFKSSQMPLSYQHCHLQPDLCCKNRLCTTCSRNFCCHSSKGRGSIEHLSYGLSSYHQKARHAKRYCRPVSGGAPFVICYKCFEMLHMPADFLISTRRLNKLKCGACSEILALPFPARANEVPQASTESGNSSEDPISFSVEYGISFAESNSTETEPERISSDKSKKERSSGSPLHRLLGYPSARQLC